MKIFTNCLAAVLIFIIGYFLGTRNNTLKVKNYEIIISDTKGTVIVKNSEHKIIELEPLRGSYEIAAFDKGGILMGKLYVPLVRSHGDDANAVITVLDRKGQFEMHSLINSDCFEGDKKNMVEWGSILHSSNSHSSPTIVP